jgi:hypothetical protein
VAAICASACCSHGLWGDVFLAPKAPSHVRAWGNAPGSNRSTHDHALKARFNRASPGLIPKKLFLGVNRAFSAGALLP